LWTERTVLILLVSRRLARLIDSTGVRLSGMGADWARFSANARGAKVHVLYDADADRPIYAAVTAAKINDITAAQTMPIESGATYVFDLGYYDYGWWAKMDAAGCRIVTRFKCLIPSFDGAIFSKEWKEALWARFSTAAPPRQRQSVEQYKIVKRA
jgi:hypothetical protein